MRKLKLQMQLSVDGFVAGPNSEMDWMHWNWDEELLTFVSNLTDSIDTILLGRKMADGFISHWATVVENPNDPSRAFGKKMTDTPKVVFTKTLDKSWPNTTLAKNDIADEVAKLKNQAGKDIIVYGGANFVSSLISRSLIDELYLFINPTAIGKGMQIFIDRTKFQLITAKPFECGIVLLCYRPIQ